MIAPLRRVVVRRPDEAFGTADPQLWHYTAAPDLREAVAEHDALVALLRAGGAEVLYHDRPLPGKADALFVHDPVLVTERGTIVLRMGKELRRGEEPALAEYLESLGVPVLYRLSGGASAEGGDLLWLDARTLAVGLGFRTNPEGLRQLGEALEPLGVELVAVPLPVYQGPAACLHLQSLISLVDEGKAVVYRPLLTVPFFEELERRGIELIDVHEDELATLGTNVLALSPGRCLMLEGNPRTRERLERAGCSVATFRGADVAMKAEGGPTCLTRPILRA